MSALQVTVLCPDGHRVTIKVTKQTPLLTILEEACGKRKLNPAIHALRKEDARLNLDTSLTVGFAGLPNHSKLEVIQCDENSKNVGQMLKIAVQLEQGGRVIGEYNSMDTLDKIVAKAEERLEASVPQDHEPVVIYMRQEVVGKEALSATTLKALGLTGGSAVLRLIHRNPVVLNDQASIVSIPAKKEEVKEESSVVWRPMRKETETAKNFEQMVTPKEEPMDVVVRTEEVCEVDLRKKDEPVAKIEEDSKNIPVPEDMKEKPKPIAVIVEDSILHYLDEDRKTVIYKINEKSAKIKAITDVSDDFFELTIEDAKVLLRDARKMQKELSNDDQVLMTERMRQAQKEGQKLALLNKYKKSVIRVQLPDRHVVQAFFLPGEELKKVAENLERYLDLTEPYELFVTPPKTVLDQSQTLLDLELVPAALIYLSSKITNESYFKSGVIDQLSNPTGAEQALNEAAILRPCSSLGSSVIVPPAVASSISTSSDAVPAAVKRPSALTNDKNDTKMPKWFKPSKK